jgi:DNA-binding CsgD family transcriptional regulator/tetratricopeptide (TPR) repeat protein
VSRVRGASAPAALSPPRLVGRDAALGELGDAVRQAASVLLIEGEPGVGKTRLVTEALPQSGTPIEGSLWVACPPLAEPYTLGPIVDALLAVAGERIAGLELSVLAGALRPLVPEWSDHLPSALEPAGDAGAARHRVFRALAELMTALDVDLVVVDDLQWSDEVTREFLLFLADRRGRPLRLVLTHRTQENGGEWMPQFTARLRPVGPLVRLTLEPLDASGTAALASSMLADQPVSQAFAEHLHGHTGGLPLAIEECVHLMIRRRDLVWREGAWSRLPLAEIVVPPTVRDAVLEQAARLAAPASAVLRAAAVAGESLSEQGLLQVSGLSLLDFTDGLADCVDHGLLRRARDGVSLRHVLAGRAIYEATPERERRALHERTGLLLEQEPAPPLARLADHFQLAGDSARWEQYAYRAVDVALETGDDTTASTLLLELIAGETESAERLCALVDKVPFGSIPTSLQLHDLADALRQMLDRGDHPPAVEAELRFQLSRVLNEVDEFEESLVEIERALPDLERDLPSVAISMIVLAWPRGRSPRSTHLRWLERATELSTKLPPTERLRVSTVRAAILLLLGDERGWAETRAIPERARNGRERRIVTLAHINVGDAAMRWGRYDEAVERLRIARRLVSDYDHARTAELVECTQVHLDWCTGEWSGLDVRASELADNEDIRPVSRLEPLMVRALLRLAAGETASAVDELERVLHGARDAGGWESVAEPAAALARIHLREGRVTEALAMTEEPVRRALDTGIWPWGVSAIPARVEALVAADKVAEAQRVTTAFGDLVGEASAAAAAAAALSECRALLARAAGEDIVAAELLEMAGEGWAGLPNPYRAAGCRERRGLLLVATGRASEGLDELAHVMTSYAALPATADVDRVAHFLRGHGRPVPRAWRGGRKGYGSDLSPRELEVVTLAAEGRTNREIAETLHRSHHTVGTQLRSAMRKLEVGSRAALAAKAVAAGLLESHEQ